MQRKLSQKKAEVSRISFSLTTMGRERTFRLIFNLEWNMFQKLIKFSIENKLTIGLLTVVLIIWGGWSLSQLPFDSTPDITNNQVQVITQAPTLGAQEVEQFITTPVEMALANIPRVTERRSISRSGLSVITLVFDDAADVYWARQQVSQQLKEAEEVLPQGKGTVGLVPVTTGLGEIYHYTLRAKKGYEDKYSLTDLRTCRTGLCASNCPARRA